MQIDNKKFWGCPSCDLLVKKKKIAYGQKAKCPRCKKTLSKPIENSIEKTLALTSGALILFFPAVFMYLMSLNLLGQMQQQSVFNSILAIFNEGYSLIALVLFLTCILVPFLKISILLYVSLGLYKQWLLPFIHASFRIYHSIDEWAMLEIYMLGILVSVVKLHSVAQLDFNLGIVLFVVYLMLSLSSSAFLDEELYWDL